MKKNKSTFLFSNLNLNLKFKFFFSIKTKGQDLIIKQSQKLFYYKAEMYKKNQLKNM